MNVPLAAYRIRLVITGSVLLLLIIVACTEQPQTPTKPLPVTAALPVTIAPTAQALAQLVSDTTQPNPAVTVVRETVYVVATPTAVPQSAPPQAASIESSNTACNRTRSPFADEIVIGTIFPMSNVAMMQNGFAMQAAANLAVKEINSNGGVNGKPLRLVAYDSGSLAAQGALWAERLITLDCVAAIVGVFHSNVAVAVKEIAVQYHVPVIFADPYAEEITADLPAEVFRIAPLRTMFTEMMGEWMATVGDYNLDQVQQAVVIVENTQYGQVREQHAQSILPKHGIEVESIRVDLPAEDFSPVIARIVALDMLPDVVFLNINDESVLPLHQQLVAAGIGPERNTLIVSTEAALGDAQYWQQVPMGNFGIALHIGPWHSTVTPMGQTFAQMYEHLFQQWPSAVAFEAYDAMWLIADAIGRADSTYPDDIIAALEQTDITLASGHYTFPYGAANPPDGIETPTYFWHQWLAPQLLYLQYTEPNQSALDATVIWPPVYRTIDTALVPDLMERRALAASRP